MTKQTRSRISRALFVLALPVCIAFLIFGWSNGLWPLAKPVALGIAGLAWWIAPASEKEGRED